MNTHYAKFEYKEMKTARAADFTQITQCKHRKGGEHIIMSTFKHFQKYNKILSNVHKIGGSHLQCVNNHSAKFEYNGMKTVGVTNYTNQTPPKHSGWKNVKLNTPQRMRKHLSNVHKIGGAHLQSVNNHYTKF